MDTSTWLAAMPPAQGGYGLTLIVALLGLLTLWTAVRAGRHLHARRLGRAASRGLGAVLLATVTAVSALLGLNLLTYARLTAERPVATLHFSADGPQRYIALLQTASGRTLRTTLDGDDWQLDARIVTWSGPGRLIGLMPLYRLERLDSRYADVKQAATIPPTVIALSTDPGLPLTTVSRYARWLPLVDARYGSAAYLPMADGAEYHVSIAASGLVARPANTAAEHAIENWR